MAVKKGSARHIRWLITHFLVNHTPPLKRRIIMYSRMKPAIEAGDADIRRVTQPIELAGEDQEFTGLLPEPVPAQLERTITRIKFHTKTLLGNTGSLVDSGDETLITFMRSRPYVHYHNFRPEVLRTVSKSGQRYFNMLGSHRGHRHLFHFLIDRMPQLFYALTLFKLAGEPLVVLTNDDLPGFQQDLYRFISDRFSNVTFEAVPRDERWDIETLYHVDYFQSVKTTMADPEFLAFLRESYMEGYKIARDPSPTDRIYICREDTKNRRFVNEPEIAAVFERFGFRKVLAGRLSFEEQVRTFSKASHVAGIHGAGLTNIIFSAPTARVLEIFPQDHVKNTYFFLSRSLGQAYHYLLGGTRQKRDHFHLPPQELEQALESFLSE